MKKKLESILKSWEENDVIEDRREYDVEEIMRSELVTMAEAGWLYIELRARHFGDQDV